MCVLFQLDEKRREGRKEGSERKVKGGSARMQDTRKKSKRKKEKMSDLFQDPGEDDDRNDDGTLQYVKRWIQYAVSIPTKNTQQD